MPTPRAPKARLQATGSILKNPKLFAGRKEPKITPLGNPSPHLNAMQRTAWEAFKLEIPWLAESDRAILEGACVLRARAFSGDELSVPALTALRQYLSVLGATPADRTRIVVAEDGQDVSDPTAGYFQ
jgi:hypothetical protein